MEFIKLVPGIAALLLILGAGPVWAQEASLTGEWHGTVVTPDGNQMPIRLNLQQQGNQLTGTVDAPQGTASIDNGVVSVAGFDSSFSDTVLLNLGITPVASGLFFTANLNAAGSISSMSGQIQPNGTMVLRISVQGADAGYGLFTRTSQ